MLLPKFLYKLLGTSDAVEPANHEKKSDVFHLLVQITTPR